MWEGRSHQEPTKTLKSSSPKAAAHFPSAKKKIKERPLLSSPPDSPTAGPFFPISRRHRPLSPSRYLPSLQHKQTRAPHLALSCPSSLSQSSPPILSHCSLHPNHPPLSPQPRPQIFPFSARRLAPPQLSLPTDRPPLSSLPFPLTVAMDGLRINHWTALSSSSSGQPLKPFPPSPIVACADTTPATTASSPVFNHPDGNKQWWRWTPEEEGKSRKSRGRRKTENRSRKGIHCLLCFWWFFRSPPA